MNAERDMREKASEKREKALRSEIASLNRKVEVETLNGIRPVLNGPLAYGKITAFELWRGILMCL